MALIERLERTLRRELREMTSVEVAVAVAPIGNCFELPAAEARLVEGTALRRRSEFSAGRACARRALGSLGCPPGPVLMGRWREPIWPPTFAGSISHDGRFAAALAYPSASGRVRLSIDLIDRPDVDRFREIREVISHPGDMPPPADTDGRALARLFSAKEAAIKILSPTLGNFVDFRQLMAARTSDGFRIDASEADISLSVWTVEVEDVLVSLGLALDAQGRSE